MVEIKTFSGKVNPETSFYIQSKGNNAGRPLDEPLANCFTVVCDERILLGKYFYYVCLNAYNLGKFKPFIKGSVVPYITKKDVCKVLNIYEVEITVTLKQ